MVANSWFYNLYIQERGGFADVKCRWKIILKWKFKKKIDGKANTGLICLNGREHGGLL